MAEGNGGDRISYTTKELIEKLDTSLGGKIDNLAEKLDIITSKQADEIREVRHRVANLEAEQRLLVPVWDSQRAETVSQLNSIEATLDVLKTDSASQHALSNLKKWMATAAIGLGGLIVAAVSLLLSIN